jgi:hypothetical protein
MTEKDIVRLAEEAELWAHKDREYAAIERFANLVAAEEREACAKVAENGRFLHDDSPEAKFGKACAAAIRARGQE